MQLLEGTVHLESDQYFLSSAEKPPHMEGVAVLIRGNSLPDRVLGVSGRGRSRVP